jgi:hypothetical protein
VSSAGGKPAARAAAAALLSSAAAASASAQCALCGEVMRTGAGEGLVRGIRWSWLLLVLPFLAGMTGVFVLMFRAFRPPPPRTGRGEGPSAPSD